MNTSIWPSPIELKKNSKESKELFYATLPSWDNFKFPMGYEWNLYTKLNVIFIVYVLLRILKGVLGESGEINAETKGILMSHNIQEEPYPKDIDQYFPPPFSVEEELKHRKDFRFCICLHKCS